MAQVRLTGMEQGFLKSAARPEGHPGAGSSILSLQRKGLVVKRGQAWHATPAGLARLAAT